MASEAQRSTGPRTSAGKHGLTSKFIVLPCESDLEYHNVRGALLSEFDPQTPSEMFLVDQLAQSWWRLNRSRRYETGMLSQLGPDGNGRAPRLEDLDHHRRYEAAIERAYYRAYDRLQRIVRRRKNPVENPVAGTSFSSLDSTGQNNPPLSAGPQLTESTTSTRIGFVSQLPVRAAGLDSTSAPNVPDSSASDLVQPFATIPADGYVKVEL